MSDETTSLELELNAIIQCKYVNEAAERFEKLIEVFAAEDSNEEFLAKLELILPKICQDSVVVILVRILFTVCMQAINKRTDNDSAIEGFKIVLRYMQLRHIAFEEQLVELRLLLSKRYELLGNLAEAAATLAGIHMESGQRVYEAKQKIEIYLTIARLYLESGDFTEAESYVNRASILTPECKDPAILIQYKTMYARSLDSKKKFLEAGHIYAELSLKVDQIDEATRLNYLEHALAASLLSSAGQQRTKLLTNLYKDERCHSLEAYPILEKMYFGKLIARSQLLLLEPLLNKHYGNILGLDQQSRTTLLERAMVEHNMIAASMLYKNIRLENLGKLLNVSRDEAEVIASNMISEDRLAGCIDQIEGYIYFESRNQMNSWSEQVESICHSVNHIVEQIEKAHPDWYNEQVQQLQAELNQTNMET